MLFIYEAMCFILFVGNTIIVRNGADILFRQLFQIFAEHSEQVYALTLLCLISIIIYFNWDVIKDER
ncbi:uncharacterized protein METZ01_LOCUS499403, partial [marine metagenome]